ncbi:Uncharacterized metal-dependent hydrolase YcfH [hydrothermal vent metagenome]|uniref:Uncharacterized metal-dependent hydrolase YcfH n=1 Tax=hydrothermal vent metagenome TaxID=652676 RepID=A0A3B0ZB95_9ZZZZ
MKPLLIDSHCHLDRLDLSQYPEGLKGALTAAAEQGVGHFLNVAINMENYPVLRDMAERHDEISISVGVHPNETEGVDPSVEQLVSEAQHPKVVAIGETGLDFFRTEGNQNWQKERFRNHITAAKESQKPLIIHMREATEATLQIMQQENAQDVGGVMHCFVEDWEIAQRVLEMGFYISFSGIVTFKSAKKLQQVARNIPLESMLIETDSPYLAPVPFRGKPNQPAYLSHIAQFVADQREISLQALGETTSKNFFELFNSAQSSLRG